MYTHEIVYILLSYLLGAIPVGYIVYYLSDRKDIRKEGSGNIGATNVLRTKGRCAAILTLLLDALKGIIPVLYGLKHFASPTIIIIGGAAAILGHLFPVYLKFKGGKGIACFVGVFLVFHYPSAFLFAAIFFAIVYSTRYVSAGSIAGIIGVSLFSFYAQPRMVSIVVSFIALIIILKHYANLKRILTHTEYQLKWTRNHHE